MADKLKYEDLKLGDKCDLKQVVNGVEKWVPVTLGRISESINVKTGEYKREVTVYWDGAPANNRYSHLKDTDVDGWLRLRLPYGSACPCTPQRTRSTLLSHVRPFTDLATQLDRERAAHAETKAKLFAAETERDSHLKCLKALKNCIVWEAFK